VIVGSISKPARKVPKVSKQLDLRHKLLLAILSKSKKAQKVIKVPKLGSFCAYIPMGVTYLLIYLRKSKSQKVFAQFTDANVMSTLTSDLKSCEGGEATIAILPLSIDVLVDT